ncbi:Putative Molybdenum cofactor synthesis protein 2B [[Torrubiella] hemipterigena]|uniref:Molybdopterin synthase catalytic subunit n=1 Tax=[Torrubiella] hemipterigena TaxID=1531966 RepID=A0A0A1TDC1_9HYPO|nr:Putative Molybdenum cofactor synthesis protein 2B [[Torrubiella] hemipterigena]
MENYKDPVVAEEDGCYVAITHQVLNLNEITDKVRSPAAGAIVLFAGTTRDNFDGKPVKELTYTAYSQLALRTMLTIARDMKTKHGLNGIAMVHRLGTVPIGEESILIAVSSPHRQAAWRAGEEALELCKDKVEVWKREEFDGEEGIWRANRDGQKGERIQ